MMLIKYIGKKAYKTDVINNTGIIWLQGETHEYNDELGALLLKYTDVWVDDSASQNQLNSETIARMQTIGINTTTNTAEDKTPAKPLIETALTVLTPIFEPVIDAEKTAVEADLPKLTEFLASLSTKKELQAFAKENNVTYANSMNETQLRAKLLRELNK